MIRTYIVLFVLVVRLSGYVSTGGHDYCYLLPFFYNDHINNFADMVFDEKTISDTFSRCYVRFDNSINYLGRDG